MDQDAHFPMVVESEIHFRFSDLGDLSCQKSLTMGNCPSIIYFINRTNPHGHWFWAFLSMIIGKCPGFLKCRAMKAQWERHFLIMILNKDFYFPNLFHPY